MTPVANRLNRGQPGLVTLRDCWAHLIVNYDQVCGTLYVSQDSSTSLRQCHLYTPPVIVRASFAERLCVATLFAS